MGENAGDAVCFASDAFLVSTCIVWLSLYLLLLFLV
jgi:hypothetical protein